MPLTFTGTPERRVGVNVAFIAAASDADRRSGWPLTAEAEVTIPSSSMII
jgi:hypothetical protein